jgi:hypothetical protein
MGIWRRLFGKVVKIGDAFFGEMVFVEISKDPTKSYFECQRYFSPIDGMIELGVTGLLDGPTQRQKDFFTQVENDYTLLVTKFIPAIEAEFGAWMTWPIIKNFEAEFKPRYFSIPACDQQPIRWEMVFDTVHDLNHTVAVGMLNYEPQYVRVDG